MDKNKKLAENLLKADGIDPAGATESEHQAFTKLLDAHLKPKATNPSFTRSKLWGFIMKNKLTKFAAATVMVIAVMVVLFTRDGSIDGASSVFAQIQKNTIKLPWQHSVTHCDYEKAGKHQESQSEYWYSFNQDIKIAKSKGIISYFDLGQRKKQVYDPMLNTLEVTYLSPKEYYLGNQQKLESSTQLLDTLIDELKERGAVIDIESSQFEGKEVDIYSIKLPVDEYEYQEKFYGTQKLVVDRTRHLLLTSETKRWSDDVGISHVFTRYDYPDEGPEDIYDMGVPETVEVLEYTPPQELAEVLDTVEAYRDSFPRRYIAIVVRSHYQWPYESYFIESANTFYMNESYQRYEERHFNPLQPWKEVKKIESQMQDSFEWQFKWWSQDTDTDLGVLFTKIAVFNGKQIHELHRQDDYEGEWKIKRKARASEPSFASNGPVNLAWPIHVMRPLGVDQITLIEDDYAKEKGLICIQMLSDGKKKNNNISRLPRKLLVYVNPDKDFICEKRITMDQLDAPWQSDPGWLDGISSSNIHKEDWTLIREVLEYSRTDSGRWYPKVIQSRQIRAKRSEEENNRNKGRLYTVYFKENPSFPEGIFDPRQLPQTVIEKVVGISDAKSVRELKQCKKQMQRIGNAIALYQNDFSDENPPDLHTLIKTEILNPSMLICPAAENKNDEKVYVFRGDDLGATYSSEMIVLYEKPGIHSGGYRNVLFASFEVEHITEEEFERLIAHDNELRQQNGLHKKPIEP